MQKLRPYVASLFLVLISANTAFADSPDLSKVQNFMQNAIQILVTIAGLLAAGFFVMGGIGYITSSGNPEHLDKSKKTITYSGLGLAICLGAFVLTTIVSDLANSSFR